MTRRLSRRSFLKASAAAFVAAVAERPAWADEDDAPLLQGKWKVVSAERNGGPYPDEMKEKMFVVFQKDEIRVFVGGTKSEQAAKFKLDPKQDPKHIDFVESTVDREWERGLLWLKLFQSWKMQEGRPTAADDKVEGIYKLDGDTLTLCWRTTKAKNLLPAGASKELTVRPTLFQSVLYYHQFLFVLKRVQPGT